MRSYVLFTTVPEVNDGSMTLNGAFGSGFGLWNFLRGSLKPYLQSIFIEIEIKCIEYAVHE